MDDSMYLVFSALLASVIVWLLNPFQRLHKLWSYSTGDSRVRANLPDEVRSFDEMPGPKGWPIIGDMLSFLRKSEFKDIVAELKDSFAKYGPVFKRNLMGKAVVYVKDPKDIEVVIKADGKHPMRPSSGVSTAVNRYRKSRKLPNGLFGLNGEEWNRVRKALASKMLRPKDIRDNLEKFNGVTKDAIEHMVSVRGADDEIPNLEEELAKWATESVGTMAFDLRVGLYDDPPNNETVRMVKATQDSFALLGKINRGWEGFLVPYVTTPTYIKYCKIQDIALEIGQSIIDRKFVEIKKMADDGEGFSQDQAVSLLTYLITKGELTRQEINVQSIGMFKAGVETTATGLLWLLYDLARNPREQEKVYEEVTSLIGPHGDFTPESFAELHYVKACVKESLRMHPGSFRWLRVLTQDVVLSGYHVPSGTAVMYSNYLAGISEELFKFPLEFRPERWLNEDLGKIHPFATLPFGVGPRMCIGRRIAEAEMYLLATKLVQRFVLEYHEEPVKPTFRLMTVPDRPIRIKFIDRA